MLPLLAPLLAAAESDPVMAIFKQSSSWRDAKGQVAHVRFRVVAADAATAQVAAQAVLDGIAGVTNAAPVAADGPVSLEMTPGIGDAAQFQSAEDKVRLVGRYENGATFRMEIPAPKATIFAADLETMARPADNADVLALTLAIAGAPTGGGEGGGEPIAGNVGQSRTGSRVSHDVRLAGFRARRGDIRRFTSATLNPTLTGPGL